MIKKKMNSRQAGQILVVVVLVIAVVLTVGLSIASRTITNLKVSKQNEESQRAFQAAESGVEAAIKQSSQPTVSSLDLGNQAGYTANNNVTGRNTSLALNNGDPVAQDLGVDVWLSHHHGINNDLPTCSGDPSDFSCPMPQTSITISWGGDGTSGTIRQDQCTAVADKRTIVPAIEVIALYNTSLNPLIKKAIYDPCGSVRTSQTSSFAAFASTPYRYKQTFDLTCAQCTGLIMKVIPLYNSTNIQVQTSGPSFPSQGVSIDSTGKSGDTVRKINYFSSFPQLPTEYFSYAILSQ